MLILAIDTSTSAIAVGLGDGGALARSAHRVDARGHTEHLAPLVAGLLDAAGVAPADLTDVVVGTGPGPFTGLRVGMVTALTMGHALGVPVHGICSLDVLAWQAWREPDRGATVPAEGAELLVATDARRTEVYWARYRVTASGPERVEGPGVDRPHDLDPALRSLPTAGRGPLLYPEHFAHPLAPLDVDGAVLAGLGAVGVQQGARMPVEPLYLRRPDALTSAERAAR